MSCGADSNAVGLLNTVTAGLSWTIPVIDMSGPEFDIPGGINNPIYQTVTKVTAADVTTRTVDGTGAFDAFMAGAKAHLHAEWENDRITGADYTKAYIALMEACLANATQFTLGKDQAFWGGIGAQVAAINGKVQIATSKMQYAVAQGQALNNKAEYGAKVLGMSNLDAEYCIQKFNLDNILPAEKLLKDAQAANMEATTELTQAQVAHESVKQELTTANINLTDQQTESQLAQVSDTLKGGSAVAGVIATQKMIAEAQEKLTLEQMEAARGQTMTTRSDGTEIDGMLKFQYNLAAANVDNTKEQLNAIRAQTMDTRVDGAEISGTLGSQKKLYDQQIESYQQDAATKAAKMWTDAWITQKTMDDGVLPPNNFANATVDSVMSALRTKAGLA